MRLADAGRLRQASFDLTPMIDVVLLLMVFFCLTSQFTEPVGIQMDLPRLRGDPAKSHAAASIMIELEADGSITVEGRQSDLARLRSKLPSEVSAARQGAGSLDVLIRADRACRTADLDALLRVLADTGIRHWKLATAGEDL